MITQRQLWTDPARGRLANLRFMTTLGRRLYNSSIDKCRSSIISSLALSVDFKGISCICSGLQVNVNRHWINWFRSYLGSRTILGRLAVRQLRPTSWLVWTLRWLLWWLWYWQWCAGQSVPCRLDFTLPIAPGWRTSFCKKWKRSGHPRKISSPSSSASIFTTAPFGWELLQLLSSSTACSMTCMHLLRLDIKSIEGTIHSFRYVALFLTTAYHWYEEFNW